MAAIKLDSKKTKEQEHGFEPSNINYSDSSAFFLMENSANPTASCSVMEGQDLLPDNAQKEQCSDKGPEMEIMHTEDPLLQETINALMNGTGGIEAVPGAPPGVSDELDNNERNYECSYCGKFFSRSNTLSYHLKVHTDEKPFKCGSCDKAFREQYRLTKHLRTHAREGMQLNKVQTSQQDTDQSQDCNFTSSTGENGNDDEDYATGDSERFFKGYEMQDETAAMKLEPDISLTVDGASTNPATNQSSSSDGDMRYQIIEERIKSLQREVHLVNQNLNRVELKIDGLTKLMSYFVGKFDEGNTQSGQMSTDSSSMIPLPVISVPIENVQPIQSKPVAAQAQGSSASVQQNLHMITSMVQLPSLSQQPSIPLGAPQSTMGSNTSNVSASYLNASCTPMPAHGSSLQNKSDTFPDIPELPIRTVNDFLDLNDNCTDNEQFLLQMMIRLHQEVDNSQPHQRNVKKMMEALVTYEVLCQFSWSGKSAINGQYTKYVFGNSVGIIDLLTKTLNLGRSEEEAAANKKPIFVAIQSFIKHSRQNMLRDSKKRRESGGVHPLATSYSIDQIQQIKIEKQDMFNQFN